MTALLVRDVDARWRHGSHVPGAIAYCATGGHGGQLCSPVGSSHTTGRKTRIARMTPAGSVQYAMGVLPVGPGGSAGALPLSGYSLSLNSSTATRSTPRASRRTRAFALI